MRFQIYKNNFDTEESSKDDCDLEQFNLTSRYTVDDDDDDEDDQSYSGIEPIDMTATEDMDLEDQFEDKVIKASEYLTHHDVVELREMLILQNIL